jgi:transposase
VRVIKRKKWVCLGCEQSAVVMAVEARIVEKGLASDRGVIETVVGTYSDHLPQYRQAAIPER